MWFGRTITMLVAYLIYSIVYVHWGLIVEEILDDYRYTLIFRLLHEQFNITGYSTKLFYDTPL